jgi:hypothetical protein
MFQPGIRSNTFYRRVAYMANTHRAIKIRYKISAENVSDHPISFALVQSSFFSTSDHSGSILNVKIIPKEYLTSMLQKPQRVY